MYPAVILCSPPRGPSSFLVPLSVISPSLSYCYGWLCFPHRQHCLPSWSPRSLALPLLSAVPPKALVLWKEPRPSPMLCVWGSLGVLLLRVWNPRLCISCGLPGDTDVTGPITPKSLSSRCPDSEHSILKIFLPPWGISDYWPDLASMLRGDNSFSEYILNTVSPSEPHDKAPALIRSNCPSKPPSVSNVRSWLEEA